MTLLHSITSRMHSVLRSEKGSVAPLVAMSAVAMIATTGAAIDMGRAQMVQARLSQSLDAAGLAAGASVNTVNVQEQVNKYFYLNYPTGYMGSEVLTLVATPTEDNSKINLSASAKVETTLMNVVGVHDVTVSATSEITRQQKGLELVLVMDNTGSMTSSAGGGLTRLQAAKNAATSLVNILYGTRTTVPDLYIGLVPFSQAVNIGPSRASWTSGTPNFGTTSWAGCVDARETSNRDTTDDPPSVALFPKYYWTCSTSNNAWFGTNSNRDNCSTGTGRQYKSGLGTALGPNKSCPQEVTPMTGNKATILAGINSMQAVGNTHISLGAAWGWRMLSPRWRTLWGGDMNTHNLPLDYNTDLMNKAVIIMTDGDNTIDNNNKGAYGYLSEGRLGTTNSSTAVTSLNTRTSSVCTSMKAQGIIVYTIAFGTGTSTTVQNMLRNCASRPEYYFASPSASDLQIAFQMIGDSLANLRISQ